MSKLCSNEGRCAMCDSLNECWLVETYGLKSLYQAERSLIEEANL
jgi:hypothetical protein